MLRTGTVTAFQCLAVSGLKRETAEQALVRLSGKTLECLKPPRWEHFIPPLGGLGVRSELFADFESEMGVATFVDRSTSPWSDTRSGGDNDYYLMLRIQPIPQ